MRAGEFHWFVFGGFQCDFAQFSKGYFAVSVAAEFLIELLAESFSLGSQELPTFFAVCLGDFGLHGHFFHCAARAFVGGL